MSWFSFTFTRAESINKKYSLITHIPLMHSIRPPLPNVGRCFSVELPWLTTHHSQSSPAAFGNPSRAITWAFLRARGSRRACRSPWAVLRPWAARSHQPGRVGGMHWDHTGHTACSEKRWEFQSWDVTCYLTWASLFTSLDVCFPGFLGFGFCFFLFVCFFRFTLYLHGLLIFSSFIF